MRYACQISGVDELALTKLDVLDDLAIIKICTGYSYQGELLKSFPADLEILATCELVYKELPGWQVPTSGIKRFANLPKNAKAYVKRIEQLIGVPIKLISVGAERNQTITK